MADEQLVRTAKVADYRTKRESDDPWDAEREGNKLILLFEGFIYGDKAVSEGMVVAAIHRFRTKQEIWINEEWNRAERGSATTPRPRIEFASWTFPDGQVQVFEPDYLKDFERVEFVGSWVCVYADSSRDSKRVRSYPAHRVEVVYA